MFEPTNTQLAARYAVNPFQRIEISLGPNIDRSQGEYFPAPQGTGFYVERSDFPVIMALVNKADTVLQAFAIRDGMQIEGFFKGFYLTHPSLNVGGAISIITFASTDAVHVNQLAQPLSRLALLNRSIVVGALLTQAAIYVPPGMRALNSLQVLMTGTTVTDVRCFCTDKNGNSIAGPTNVTQQIAGAVVTYNAGAPGPLISGPPRAVSAGFVMEFPSPLIIPTLATEVVVTVQGTVLSGLPTFTGYWT